MQLIKMQSTIHSLFVCTKEAGRSDRKTQGVFLSLKPVYTEDQGRYLEILLL